METSMEEIPSVILGKKASETENNKNSFIIFSDNKSYKMKRSTHFFSFMFGRLRLD